MTVGGGDEGEGNYSATELRLSHEARTQPLQSEWLTELRDFLTRSGAWRHHPVATVEIFAATPRVMTPGARVIGTDRPIFTSLGYGVDAVEAGRPHYRQGVCVELQVASVCSDLICVSNTSGSVLGPECLVLGSAETEGEEPSGGRATTHGTQDRDRTSVDDIDNAIRCLALDPVMAENAAGACYDSFCGGESCLTENCKSLKCSTNNCSTQFCGNFVCGTKGSCGDKNVEFDHLLAELEAYVDHPFVRELQHFLSTGVGDYEALERGLMDMIAANMFSQDG